MARLARYACLLVLLFPSVALAQTVTPSGYLGWDWTGTATDVWFEVSMDGVTAKVTPSVTGTTYTVPLPPAPAGVHTFGVRACNSAGCTPAPNQVSVTYASTPPPPPPCDATRTPSVFVTRWEHTTGNPGSRFRLNYQVSAPVPIVEVEARIAGKTLSKITGTDLRDSGGIWLVAPAAGIYPVSIWAKTSEGCTREAAALVNLVVK